MSPEDTTILHLHQKLDHAGLMEECDLCAPARLLLQENAPDIDKIDSELISELAVAAVDEFDVPAEHEEALLARVEARLREIVGL
mgnify:CR=1 FL=1